MELDELLAVGESALQQAVDRQEVESLTLDFKESGKGAEALFVEGQLTRQGQRAIGPALSAFANSAGGLLIIGVTCKLIQGIDAASQLVPLTELKRSQSALSGHLGSMLQPRHDGLQLHTIPSSASEDCGYLVVEVPRSERRPHMAQSDHHYYKRSGASNFRMEHYDIEDAFKRVTAPVLETNFDLKKRITLGRKSAQFKAEIAIKNIGVVSASAPHIVFSGGSGGGFEIESPNEVTRFRDSITIATNNDFLIHPQQTKRLGDLLFWAHRGEAGSEDIGGEHGARDTFIKAPFSITARDMRPLSGEFNFDLTLIQKLWPIVE